MKLSEYFEETQGHGILATADLAGLVDAAVYARPYFVDEDTVAFVMAERLTHRNLQSNPHAVYLFIQDGPGYAGKRLYLKKTKEDSSDDMIKQICRKCDYSFYQDRLARFVVFFHVDKVLPLVSS